VRIIIERAATNKHQKRNLKAGLDPVISTFNGTLSHLFEGTSGEHHEQLGKYYRVQAHVDHHETLIQHLRRHPDVDHAYISPSLVIPDAELTDAYKAKLKARAQAASKTPDMTKTQQPLWQAADKDGMDINYSWSQKGGRGDSVQVFQIEFNWLHTHEDLQNNMRFVGPDGPIGTHATGAAGVVGADENGIGYNGIVPNAQFTARSLYFDEQSAKSGSQNLARAFQWCVDNGKAGDVIMTIIVVDMGAGDKVTGPVEWWPEYFDVIKRATDKGMIVVTSAGNDGANLDNPGELSCILRSLDDC
jgi:subtilisin family serine protease